MKKLLGILVLGLLLITPSLADDISDFEIEGMSIGDSALDFFSKEEINNYKMNYFKNKKYTPVEIQNVSFLKTYNSIAFTFKTGDSNYKIVSLTGHFDYPDNMSDCDKKLDMIVADLNSLFKNVARGDKKTFKQTINEPNDTQKTMVAFWFDTDDLISVSCYDYSLKSGYMDNLAVTIDTKEYNDFLNIAYK